MQDRIEFSVLTLDIYQRQRARHDVLKNKKNIDRYKPGFFSQLGDALLYGWEMLKDFVLFHAGSWSLVLLAVVLCVLFRRLFRK